MKTQVLRQARNRRLRDNALSTNTDLEVQYHAQLAAYEGLPESARASSIAPVMPDLLRVPPLFVPSEFALYDSKEVDARVATVESNDTFLSGWGVVFLANAGSLTGSTADVSTFLCGAMSSDARHSLVMKPHFGGTFYFFVAMDFNHQVVVIACAHLLRNEDEKSWNDVFQLVKDFVPALDSDRFVNIADHDKGMESASESVLEHMVLFRCGRHSSDHMPAVHNTNYKLAIQANTKRYCDALLALLPLQ